MAFIMAICANALLIIFALDFIPLKENSKNNMGNYFRIGTYCQLMQFVKSLLQNTCGLPSYAIAVIELV